MRLLNLEWMDSLSFGRALVGGALLLLLLDDDDDDDDGDREGEGVAGSVAGVNTWEEVDSSLLEIVFDGGDIMTRTELELLPALLPLSIVL